MNVEAQQLAGRRVCDAHGEVAGRIESIRAERTGPRCVITEFHLGTAALLSRLGISTLRLFGLHHSHAPLRVPWDRLDISNPRNPRLRCTVAELKAMQPALPPFEDDDGPPT